MVDIAGWWWPFACGFAAGAVVLSVGILYFRAQAELRAWEAADRRHWRSTPEPKRLWLIEGRGQGPAA